MDKKKLWGKLLKKLFLSVPVITLGGLTVISLIASWAFEFRLLLLNILPLVFGVLTIGTVLQMFLLSGEEMAREALNELKGEVADAHEQRLDVFYKKLSKDGDPRTHKALNDTRELARAIKSALGEDSKLDAQSRLQMHDRVDRLFADCVDRLENSLSLIESARNISDHSIQRKILETREKIIDEIATMISYLGKILQRIQTLNVGEPPDHAEFVQIMSDLDEGIEIAKQVDERMKKLERRHRQTE